MGRCAPLLLGLSLAACRTPPPAPAAGAGPGPAAAVAIDLYPGQAVVRERRRVRLARGRGRLRIEDLPVALRPESLRLVSLTDPEGTRALAQAVPRPAPARPEPARVEATGDPRWPLRMPARAAAGPAAPAVPGATWEIDSTTGGEHEVAVEYLLPALGWRADYVILLTGDEPVRADVNAWITVANRSGRTFRDAAVTLLAPRPSPPSVEPAPAPVAEPLASNPARPPAVAPAGPPVPRHRRYRYPRPVTLAAGGERQLEWFSPPLRGLAAHKLILYDATGERLDRDEAEPVAAPGYGLGAGGRVELAVELPAPPRALPPGRVRVFERGAGGALARLGEAALAATAAGEPVRVRLGPAAGLEARRRQTDFRLDRRTRRLVEEIEVELRNRGQRDRVVVVREHLYRGARFTVTSSRPGFRPDGARAIRFDVPVAAGAGATVRYRVVYTWAAGAP